MKPNVRFPNSRAEEAWGLPAKILTDRSHSFQSTPLNQALMTVENACTRKINQQT